MFYCCVPFCKSHLSRNNAKITFHEFPCREPLRSRWIERICRKDIHGNNRPPDDRDKVCSLHFKEENFRIGTKKRLLKYDAVPSIFNLQTLYQISNWPINNNGHEQQVAKLLSLKVQKINSCQAKSRTAEREQLPEENQLAPSLLEASSPVDDDSRMETDSKEHLKTLVQKLNSNVNEGTPNSTVDKFSTPLSRSKMSNRLKYERASNLQKGSRESSCQQPFVQLTEVMQRDNNCLDMECSPEKKHFSSSSVEVSGLKDDHTDSKEHLKSLVKMFATAAVPATETAHLNAASRLSMPLAKSTEISVGEDSSVNFQSHSNKHVVTTNEQKPLVVDAERSGGDISTSPRSLHSEDKTALNSSDEKTTLKKTLRLRRKIRSQARLISCLKKKVAHLQNDLQNQSRELTKLIEVKSSLECLDKGIDEGNTNAQFIKDQLKKGIIPAVYDDRTQYVCWNDEANVLAFQNDAENDDWAHMPKIKSVSSIATCFKDNFQEDSKEHLKYLVEKFNSHIVENTGPSNF